MRFATKQKQTLAYLDSDEFRSREDADSTLGSINILKKIIQKGLVTDNSQEGLIITGYNPDSKRYYRIEERAYVTGIMKEADAYKFVARINETTDKVAFIVRNDSSKEYKALFDSNKPIPSIPVTVSGTSTTKDGKKSMSAFTKLPLAIPTQYLTEVKGITDKVEEVAVFDPQYGRKATSKKGLYQDILNALSL